MSQPTIRLSSLLVFAVSIHLATSNATGQETPASTATAPERSLIIVVGTPGEPKYEQAFAEAAQSWRQIAKQHQIPTVVIGFETKSEKSDIDKLLEQLAQRAQMVDELWLVMIGHGTFDGRKSKFNLRGPDITADELGKQLETRQGPTLIFNCASSSGPFIKALSGEQRVVITATNSGDQYNATQFGTYLGTAIGEIGNDLDKDGQVSVLEAFVAASAATQDYYQSERRLSTETALLDDNGDQLGTPADWFQGVRAIKRPRNAKEADGRTANQLFLIRAGHEIRLTESQRARRDELEAELEVLRARKQEFGQEAYLKQLEPLLIELAKIYRDAD